MILYENIQRKYMTNTESLGIKTVMKGSVQLMIVFITSSVIMDIYGNQSQRFLMV